MPQNLFWLVTTQLWWTFQLSERYLDPSQGPKKNMIIMLILMPKSIELSVVCDEAAERHLDKSVGNRILKFFVDMVTQESSDFSNFSWLSHQLEKK